MRSARLDGVARGGRAEAELLGKLAPRAAGGCADEDRGGRGFMAFAEGCGGLCGRVPKLEGDHEGDCEDARGVGEVDLPYLIEAGMAVNFSLLTNKNVSSS